MFVFDPRKILEVPFIYKSFQNLTRTRKHNKKYIEEVLKIKESDKILDIGCGPAYILNFFPKNLLSKIEYWGFDSNLKYIDEAKKSFEDAHFVCKDLKDKDTLISLEKNSYFDVVLATGVLHHLNDDEAINLFNIALEALKPGGRLITLDNYKNETDNPLMKLWTSLDRGQFSRTEQEYVKVADKVFSNVKHSVSRGELTNIPQSLIVMECIKN